MLTCSSFYNNLIYIYIYANISCIIYTSIYVCVMKANICKEWFIIICIKLYSYDAPMHFKKQFSINYMLDSPFPGTIQMYSFIHLFKKYSLNTSKYHMSCSQERPNPCHYVENSLIRRQVLNKQPKSNFVEFTFFTCKTEIILSAFVLSQMRWL